MGDYTKYGMCGGECGKWVPRDDMLSINVAVYDAENVEERIPLRFCPKCHDGERSRLQNKRWVNGLKFEIEIKTDPALAKNSDLEYDGSDEAMERAQKAASIGALRPKDGTFTPPQKDDSEAAMRRKGKRIDIQY